MDSIAEKALSDAKNHSLLTYPEEGCGLFFRQNVSNKIDLFLPCQNIQNQLHGLDPERYPRDARRAYSMEDQEINKLKVKYQDTHRVAGIFHSHNDVGVYFSDEDQAMACPWGEPLFPDQFYMIIGVNEGKALGGSVFVWSERLRKYEETAFALN